MIHCSDPAALEASLSRRYRVVETDVEIAGRMLSIVHPASADELIDERDFERDERLPYWAELWPSSRVLAEVVAGFPGPTAGHSLLDLGCGAGVVSTAASVAGFSVVVSDYYNDAIAFAQVNAWRNDAPVPAGLPLDWRYLPADLSRFDTVVASDVLYEKPYGALVARAIDASLAKGGVAYLADPGRVGRDDFLRTVACLPLSVTRRTEVPFVDGPVRQTISVFEIRRRDPSH